MGTWNQLKNKFNANRTRFSLIFSKLMPYLILFQSVVHQSCGRTSKNHQIWHQFGKNQGKPCSTCLKPISPWHKTWVSKMGSVENYFSYSNTLVIHFIFLDYLWPFHFQWSQIIQFWVYINLEWSQIIQSKVVTDNPKSQIIRAFFYTTKWNEWKSLWKSTFVVYEALKM